jgi:hypothetical protein
VGATAVLFAACGDASAPSPGYRQVGGTSSGDPGNEQGTSSGQTSSGGTSSGQTSSSGGTSSGQTSSSGASGTVNPGTFDLILDKATGTGDMATSFDVQVTVEPKDGFKGKVDLKVTGLPTDAVGTFDKPSVDIGPAAATAKLTITTKTTTPPATSQLKITGTSGTQSHDAPTYGLTINPKLTLHIKMNATGTDFVQEGKDLTVATGGKPVTVVFHNNYSSGFIIHAGNPPTFPHGNTGAPIQPNTDEAQVRSISAGTNYVYYSHAPFGDPGAANRAILRAQ